MLNRANGHWSAPRSLALTALTEPAESPGSVISKRVTVARGRAMSGRWKAAQEAFDQVQGESPLTEHQHLEEGMESGTYQPGHDDQTTRLESWGDTTCNGALRPGEHVLPQGTPPPPPPLIATGSGVRQALP